MREGERLKGDGKSKKEWRERTNSRKNNLLRTWVC